MQSLNRIFVTLDHLVSRDETRAQIINSFQPDDITEASQSQHIAIQPLYRGGAIDRSSPGTRGIDSVPADRFVNDGNLVPVGAMQSSRELIGPGVAAIQCTVDPVGD